MAYIAKDCITEVSLCGAEYFIVEKQYTYQYYLWDLGI